MRRSASRDHTSPRCRTNSTRLSVAGCKTSSNGVERYRIRAANPDVSPAAAGRPSRCGNVIRVGKIDAIAFASLTTLS
jgi:hypothetical protein